MIHTGKAAVHSRRHKHNRPLFSLKKDDYAPNLANRELTHRVTH